MFKPSNLNLETPSIRLPLTITGGKSGDYLENGILSSFHFFSFNWN